jgi:cobaltochelatase CobN
VLPVFSSPDETMSAIGKYFNPDGKPAVDAVVSLRWFRLTQFSAHDPDAGVRELKRLGVPVFNGAPIYGRKVRDWRESIQGFAPFETLSAVILPELDGLIEPLPLAGLEEIEDASLGGTLTRVVAIEDRVDRMASRLARLFRLQRLTNVEKRVALIIYNNPPGEDNIGNAAYLDTFESLRRLLLEMKARGYQVDNVPEVGRFPERFIEQGLVNHARWGGEDRALEHGPEVTAAQYEGWLAKLPAGAELAENWGKPPGTVMVEQGRFNPREVARRTPTRSLTTSPCPRITNTQPSIAGSKKSGGRTRWSTSELTAPWNFSKGKKSA